MARQVDSATIPPDILTLLRRAETGDTDVLPELRTILDRHPEIWQACGDLAQQAEDAWLTLLAGDNLLAAEAIARQLEDLTATLGRPKPSPLEKLLIDRAANWLQLQFADLTYAQAKDNNVAGEALPELRRRQDSAHRRYLDAVKSLAQVRKLLAQTPCRKPRQLGDSSLRRARMSLADASLN